MRILFRFFAFFVILGSIPVSAEGSHPRVMVLHSYHQGLLWTDQIQRGLDLVLIPAGVESQIVHLDFHRYPERWTDPAYLAYLEKGIRRQSPDLVIVADNDALRYYTTHRARLAPAIPLVFLGINDLASEVAARGPAMTGVGETPSFAASFALMRALQPDLQRVLVLGEAGVTGQANRTLLERQLAEAGDGTEILFHEDAKIGAILARLAVPDYDAVFLMCRPRDDSGYPLAEAIAGKQVSRASRVPVYSGWDFMLQAGIVGGVMVSGQRQGETAAGLALRILDGERVDSIPPVRESPNRAVVDADGLRRFGLARERLPGNFEILHDEADLLEIHGGRLAALATILVLLVVLVVLLWRNGRRQAAEAHAWQDTFDAVGDGICLLDAEQRIVRMNRTMQEMFELDGQDFSGRTCWKIFHDANNACHGCPVVRSRESRHRERLELETAGRRFEVVVDPRFGPEGRYLGAVHLMHDITERQQAESTLRSILDVAPYGVFVYELLEDDRLVFRSANRAADTILGVSCAGFVGRTLEANFPALTATEIPAAYRAVVRDGLVYENQQVDYHEKEIVGAFDVRAVRIMSGHVGVFFRDVTETNKAEAALLAKTGELDRFFSVTLDLLCIAGLDGCFRRVNAQWEQVLGYSREELEGRGFLDFVHPEDRDATITVTAELAAGKDAVGFVNRYRARNGEYRLIEWRSTAVTGLIYAAARDVTEQRRAEAALRGSEARFRNLFESMREGVVYHGADGAIIDVNPAAERILGLSREQLLGRSSIDPRWRCLHEDGSDYPGETHPVMVALRTGEPVLDQIMGIFVPELQMYHWAVVNAVPLEIAGEVGLAAAYATITDITDLQSANSRLRELNANLQRSQKIAHIGDWKLDLADGRFHASAEALALLGFPENAAPGFEEVASLIEGPDRQRAHEALQGLLATGEAYSLDLRFRRYDNGKTIHVLSIGELQRDMQGGPQAVFGINQDITERKNAESALREGERRFHSLFDNMAEGVALHTVVFGEEGNPVDYILMDTNPQYEKLTGIRVEDVRGRRAQEVYGTDSPPFLEAFTRVAVTGNPDHLTLFFPPMDKYFEISVAPWGESGFATIFSDVTGRKRAMEALQASEQRLSSVVSNLAVVLYALDENGIFLLSEGKGLAMLGLQPGEVVGRSAIEMYAPFAEVSQGLARALAGESFMHVAPLGDFWFEIWYSPVRDPAGRLAGTIGVAFDISDRIRLDQEREILIRELETKNAELERFTYTVSHDLKSPLITIKGFVGMLDADMREGNAELAAKDMQRIAAAADRMQNLLEDLLELSRIGRIVNPPSLFRMDEPLREALEMLDGVTRERQVVLDIVGQWPEVEADRVRIREVWQNLVENSVKYMGDQPAPRIVVGSRVENGEKCFFVGDNGIGIAEQYRERVFRLFEKLDPASEGTGIGLALVARIIDLHGGRVWIEAGQEGVGTTVWFSIGS